MTVSRKSSFVLCFLLLMFALVSCLDVAYVEKVVIECGSTEVAIGSTLNLKTKITPANATVQAITWTSDNPSVATVDENGVVTGHAKGKATITAKSVENSTKSDKVTISVVDATGTLKVSVEYAEGKLPDGWLIEVRADGEILGTLNSETQSISKLLIVDGHSGFGMHELTMNQKGLDRYEVGFVAGTSLSDKSNAEIQKDQTVGVSIVIASIPVETVSITSQTGSQLYVGEKLTLAATVTPANATVQAITWTSDNPSVATVDENGVVTGHAKGKATITAKSISTPGIEDSLEITVVEPEGTLTVSADYGTLVLPDDWYVDVVKADGSSIGRLNKNNPSISKNLLEGSCEITFNSNLGNYYVSFVNGAVLSETIDVEIERGKSTGVELRIEEIPVASISITPTAAPPIYIDDTFELGVTVFPDQATNKDVKWVSQDINIATVDKDGKVTGIKAGDTVITAISKSNPNATDEIRVFVVEPTGDLVVKTDIEEGLTPPEGWSIIVKSDDMDIFTLNENYTSGKTRLNCGKYNLKITKSLELANYNVGFASGTLTETTEVDISKDGMIEVTIKIIAIPVSGISLSIPAGSSNTICNGDDPDKLQLTATVTPDNATDASLNWTSSNTDVATVDNNGLVTAGSSTGTAIITATSVSNPAVRSDEIHVHVKEPTGNLQVNVKYGELKLPAPTDWFITVYDGEKELGTLSESSIKNPLEIEGLVVGEHSITLESKNLDRYKVTSSHPNSINIKRDNKLGIKITIAERPVESISLSSSSITLDVNDTHNLIATVDPQNATDSRLKWTSSNEKVATVDQNGVVTGVAEGDATIKVESIYNSTISAECKVKVVIPTGRFQVLAKNDGGFDLPSGWTIKVKSGDKLIATLAKNTGMITRDFNVGEYDITVEATGLDNYNVAPDLTNVNLTKGVTATITVNIEKRPVESITLSPSREGSLNLGDTLTLTPAISPEHTTEQTITWTSSNESVAKVDGNGNVTTQGTPGTAVIKAEIDGKSAAYTVTVDDEISVYGRAQLLQRNFIEEDVPVGNANEITVTATVTLANSSKITKTTMTEDTQGHFSFSDLPRGIVTFAFTKDDTSYGCDTFDYTEVTATQTPNKIMLLAINKSTDDENNVTGFGSYYNVNTQQTWNGEWRVLDRVDNKALLVSSIILFDAPYSASEASWNTSDLKKQLNGGEFLDKINKINEVSKNPVFTERQKKYIDGNEGDKVFLLSVDEANGYFNSDGDRKVETLDINTSGNPYKGWWLRESKNTSTPPYVSENGYVHKDGSSSHGVGAEKYGVRPAIWVQL